MIDQVMSKIALSSGVVSATAVGALMLTVIADTAGRFLFGTPIPGANDLNRYWWMIVIVFGALGVAEKRNEHIEALVLETQMPPRLKVIWRYIRTALVAVVLVLLINAAFPAAIRHHAQGEYAAGSEITIWPTRYILVIGAAIFLLITIAKTFEDRRTIRQESLKGSGQE